MSASWLIPASSPSRKQAHEVLYDVARGLSGRAAARTVDRSVQHGRRVRYARVVGLVEVAADGCLVPGDAPDQLAHLTRHPDGVGEYDLIRLRICQLLDDVEHELQIHTHFERTPKDGAQRYGRMALRPDKCARRGD